MELGEVFTGPTEEAKLADRVIPGVQEKRYVPGHRYNPQGYKQALEFGGRYPLLPLVWEFNSEVTLQCDRNERKSRRTCTDPHKRFTREQLADKITHFAFRVREGQSKDVANRDKHCHSHIGHSEVYQK